MTSAQNTLDQPLQLPCGLKLKNRIVKAAMTEGLAAPDARPNADHVRLYRTWAKGGAGLLITGNVIVDDYHLERPGNVTLSSRPDKDTIEAFRAWGTAGADYGCDLWMQLSHAGRQTQKLVNPKPKSASDVQLALPGGQFARPTPLTEDEIEDLIGRFAGAARVAQETGFSGVQIHAAHGYLLSQFLSPLANRRTDRWGGSLENRCRLLREIIAAVRAATDAGFAISVKLNSSDFQKGGFDAEDARQVVRWLGEDGVDLVELSGGTYEQPKMLELEGLAPAEEIRLRKSTREREAFFLAFAAEIGEEVKVPLMVTGGFRSASAMATAITEDGIDAIGVGRPLCGAPDAPQALLSRGEDLPRFERLLGNRGHFFGVDSPVTLVKAAASFAVMSWYYDQILSMAKGTAMNLSPHTFSRFLALRKREMTWVKARKRWLSAKAA